MKGFIEWTEGNISRARKVVLMSTVIVFLLITIGVFSGAIWGLTMAPVLQSLYVTLVTLMIAVYGFYTGTSSEKSSKLADTAADMMLEKFKAIEEANRKEELKNEDI